MSPTQRLAAVTGAFSYSGSYIAEALLHAGWRVLTLTRRPGRPHRLQGKLPAHPMDFSRPSALVESLRGAHVLVNTYWVRFNYRGSSFTQAIENTRVLLAAAKEAGVRRLVHLSVSNADLESDLPYYRGKAEVEEMIRASGLSHAILQPTLIFGLEELLVNNIAWLLRRFPLFPIPGDGEYRLQPIYVRDLAELASQEAGGLENTVIPAGGPEILTYNELLHFLKEIVGSRAWLPHLAPAFSLAASKLLNPILRDVLLTRDELSGLMQERLYVGLPAHGQTPFTNWARQHAADLGRSYANELQRHH